ncbi:MAG TPA: hypothetical protein VIS28_05500 [Nitrososphaeraceae archaeon]
MIPAHISGVNSVAESSFGTRIIGSAIQSYNKHSLHKGNPVICSLQHAKKSSHLQDCIGQCSPCQPTPTSCSSFHSVTP